MCKTPNGASNRCSAFSSIASNTGARSSDEELMTSKTSAVAVCFVPFGGKSLQLGGPSLQFRVKLSDRSRRPGQ